jgi:hypothetical protein
LPWLSDRHELVKPAQLLASSAEEAARIEAQLEAADGMLSQAKELADTELLEAQSLEAERRRKLAERLAGNQNKQRKLFDPMEFAVALKDVLLADFAPTMHWHSAAPSPKQLNAIERFGINPESIRSRGHASALLDKLCKRSRLSLATPAQLRWLVKLQHPAPTLVSFKEASAFLSEQFNRRRGATTL